MTAGAAPDAGDASPRLALVVLWSASDPSRVGEVLLMPRRDDSSGAPQAIVFGRGGPRSDDGSPRALFVRQRPGINVATAPLDDPFISRRQLELRVKDGAIAVDAVGTRPVWIGGRATQHGVVAIGETLEIKSQLLLLCVERPGVMTPPAQEGVVAHDFAFGDADEHGIVGETPAAWALREQMRNEPAGVRVALPGLDQRREDVPLLVRHLLWRIGDRDARVAQRFFGAGGEPRVSPALVRALTTHTYTRGEDELQALVLHAIAASETNYVDVAETRAEDVAKSAPPEGAPRRAVTPDDIRASLARHGGVRERVWRELGMANRYVLKRLMKKYAIDASPDDT